ncbi:hypothetical protein Nitsa_0839 [Nitratifractor salsuginis DSM 16511]|uniref:Uncharacterized protein n=1 Tax=Nitratifractor salsuginis (strain DSM 16511 / JCM 12458 / E9I37-1) TaxID=749222 RepID=E6X2N4_NITSE|nr:hypothetical protein Nitsa_0839 [Nitratifractor salsuginis DSM 16511]
MTTCSDGILKELQENILKIINKGNGKREKTIIECFMYLRDFSKKFMNEYCLESPIGDP